LPLGQVLKEDFERKFPSIRRLMQITYANELTLVANSGFVVRSRVDISPKPALAGAFGLADARRGGYDGRAAEFATSVRAFVKASDFICFLA
jgi:hypothetical protein